ncbi:MAG: hypothetical protein ABDH21_06755 [bacterium]
MNINKRVISSFVIFSSVFILIISYLIYTNNLSSQVFAEEKQKGYTKEMREDIQNSQEFWNYLQKNHPETYNLLNHLKNQEPKYYKRFVKITSRLYIKLKKTQDQELKNIFSDQIDKHTKFVKLIIDYKDKKINEDQFKNEAKQILNKIHDNVIRVMEIKLQKYKMEKQQKIEKTIEKIVQKVDKHESLEEDNENEY